MTGGHISGSEPKAGSVNSYSGEPAEIESGDYPFLNNFYVVIRKSEVKYSNARKAPGWFLNSEGRKAIEKSGYVYIDYR